MEKLISGPLADALAANRVRFNSLVAQAAQVSSRFDYDDFGHLLRGPLQELVDAVARAAPERAAKSAAVLFETGLTLFSQGWLGSRQRTPLVSMVWSQLLPQAAALLSLSPRRVTGALSNAAVNLAQEESGIGQRWLRQLQQLTPRCTSVDHLLDSALVVAWRAGMPHFRETALEHWRRLPDQLQALCMGLDPGQVPAAAGLLEQTLNNPWHPPHLAGSRTEVRLTIVGRVGRFKGVGGPFGEPPLVAGNGSSIIAYDSEGSHSLWADCFGVSLRRAADTRQLSDSGYRGFSIDKAGTVTFGTLQAPFPPLANCSSFTATATTLAVTLPHSHSVYVVAPLITEYRP